MSTLIIARVVLVVFAFIFLIGFQRRKQLFTVKNAAEDRQKSLVDDLITSLLRDNRLLLVVSVGAAAFALAYIVYMLYVPTAG